MEYAMWGWPDAVVAAIVAAAVSYLIAAKSNYVNSVTVERSKWIERLRFNIATFSGIARSLSYKFSADVIKANSSEHVTAIRDMNVLIATIKLQLNPGGTVDKHIISLLDKMPALSETINSASALRRADDLLIAHSQWLLKDEWEKVKREARMFSWVFSSSTERLRSIRYTEFCRTHDVDKV
jgi:hypothetical protein